MLFGMMGAMALSFNACSSDDALVDNPNYDKETNTVKTSFAFNIATDTKTRMTDAVVQDNKQFRGMEGMNLFVSIGHPLVTEFKEGYVYDLGKLGSGTISETQSSKIYNLTFPLKVDNMVFYGKATGNTDNKTYGKLGYNIGTTKAGTHFDMTPILAETTDFDNRGAAWAYILNDIISAEGWAGTVATAETNVLYQPIAAAYQAITNVGANELRLGSGPALVRTINDLYLIMTSISSGTGNPEALKTIATKVIEKIVKYFNTNPFDVKVMDALKTIDDANFTALVDGMQTGDLKGFPSNLGLPPGSAQLVFTDNKFSYVAEPGTLRNTTVAGVTKFTYPAELCYWQCSPIRVSSDETITAADYPVTVANWDVETWTGHTWTKNGSISSSTRAVAFQNNIQYAVAGMKTTLKYGTTELKDNNKAMTNNLEEDKTVEITSADKLQVTGILVGGQPQKAEWNWVAAAATDRDYVVYDTEIPNATIPTTGTSEPIYTLLLDNYNASKDADNQDVVNIAIEFLNNTGKDFWGADNLIRQNGHFYLAAQLDLKKLTAEQKSAILALYPENADTKGYRYPPMNNDQTNNRVIRVFMQDFLTEVNLTIGENTLKYAYATVPDLRSVEMTFGLSVDLKWRKGGEFNINLGGE